MFDFGIKYAIAMPARDAVRVLAMWSWTIIFRDDPRTIWHIVRRSGNLKKWATI